MNGGLVFAVAFVVVLAVCLRLRASVIVTLGGSVLAGFVALAVLGERQPVGVDESTVAAAVAGSDDFDRHGPRFVQAAVELVRSGRCSPSELRDVGGWLRSSAGPPWRYFTYCGGMTLADRLYLDVRTGDVSR